MTSTADRYREAGMKPPRSTDPDEAPAVVEIPEGSLLRVVPGADGIPTLVDTTTPPDVVDGPSDTEKESTR
ncbi:MULTISPECIES: hypothetical protein [unclassified Agrococcus]|uniref:hypothetical protein n=1 Tax=unclassified Agrococcus TaxID=2615065 RepID=UPI00360DFAC2